jgi:hypothetical protein
MPAWVFKILGINWRTTLLGWSVMVAAVGRIAVAWRTRDFGAILADGQLILETVATLLAGFGLIKAKDQHVIGAGTQARTIDTSTGDITNREGQTVGKEPALPPQPKVVQ